MRAAIALILLALGGCAALQKLENLYTDVSG